MKAQKSLEEMHLLANSIRRVYNRLLHTTDRLHEAVGLSAPKRTLLQDLHRDGAQTVPALAAFRYVSRQIVQTQVNELLVIDLVKALPNPEHKRSSLIALTTQGQGLVERMIAEETKLIEQLGWLPKEEDLATCRTVLDTIYDQLDDLKS